MNVSKLAYHSFCQYIHICSLHASQLLGMHESLPCVMILMQVGYGAIRIKVTQIFDWNIAKIIYENQWFWSATIDFRQQFNIRMAAKEPDLFT